MTKQITCDYCGTQRSSDDHRCSRCGRRFDVFPVMRSAAAPDLHSISVEAAATPPLEVMTPDASGAPIARELTGQATLFGPPPRLAAVPPPIRKLATVPDSAGQSIPVSAVNVRRPRRGPVPEQQALEFTPVFTTIQKQSRPDAVIYCEAPVAPSAARLAATALDVAMVLVAAGLFLGVFLFGGGAIALNNTTAFCFGGAILGLTILYKYLWMIAGADSPGSVWVGLRVINFDGYPPTRAQRIQRLAAACLGLAAAGLGMLWSLADEETLTWHDHISKTFPTTVPRQ